MHALYFTGIAIGEEVDIKLADNYTLYRKNWYSSEDVDVFDYIELVKKYYIAMEK